jgi:leader peptidase (prepilin peptidase)/N-methyltransferase
VRYPLVELTTAVVFGVTAWRIVDIGRPWALPAFLYLAAVGVALALIDIDTGRLPIVIVRPAFGVGGALLLAASAAHDDWGAAVRAGIGMASLFCFYFVLHVAKPGGMGYGDVRLSGLLGLYLGWLGWPELVVGAFLAFVLGGVLGVLQAALSPHWERRNVTTPPGQPTQLATVTGHHEVDAVDAARPVLKRRIPFGPYMLVGALAGILFARPIADWYLGNLTV